MSILLASGFLPLLLLTWLPAGLAHQSPGTINVSLGSELTFQCLSQTASNSTATEVIQFKGQNKSMWEKVAVFQFLHQENGSANLTFKSVNEAHTEIYMCEMRSTSGMGDGTNETHQGSDPEMCLTSTPEPTTQEGIIYMYVIPASVAGTLLLLICLLVCLCRRNRRNAEGKCESRHVAEMNQRGTPQTEEVMYAKLKFEKTETKPAASEVVYTEIKSPQQK